VILVTSYPKITASYHAQAPAILAQYCQLIAILVFQAIILFLLILVNNVEVSACNASQLLQHALNAIHRSIVY